ncbi:MAG TPA: oligosaccharide flippase family protein [Longimicrobium sp.]|nr:oligosaccharide flippase family protein [Longimicrobium sp.]
MAAQDVSPRAPRWGGRGRVMHNAAASLAGNTWTAILGLLLVPVYVRYVGVEAYGLIGLFAVLQSVAALLDMGLSTTLSRELARLSGLEGTGAQMRDLVRSLAVVYWGVGALICLVTLGVAPLLAHHWVTSQHLGSGQVIRAFMLLGASFALQWPQYLYMGGLEGLQRHVQTNTVLAVVGTIRSVGALAVLAWVSPTLDAFLTWQIVTAALQTLLLGALLRRALPPAPAGRFRAAELRRLARFAAGVSALSLLSLGLTSADKVVLSRILPLREFGYYSLAGAVTLALTRVTAPLFSAFFPRFSELVAQMRDVELRRLYHRGCGLMALLVLPASLVLVAFAPEVLRVWSGNPDIVREARLPVALLAGGTALNALMVMPYALQVAHGWTRLLLVSNAVAVAVLVPLVTFTALRWGAPGAAAAWLILNAGYVVIQPPIIHRRLLKGELARWYLHDVAGPLAAAGAVALAARFLLPWGGARMAEAGLLAVTGCSMFAAAALTQEWARETAGRVLARAGLFAGAPGAVR